MSRNDLGIGVHDFVSYASLANGVDSMPLSQDWGLSSKVSVTNQFSMILVCLATSSLHDLAVPCFVFQ